MIITFLDVVLFSTYFLLLFLSIFWLLVLISPEDKKPKKKLGYIPNFSVIVPAYNEEESITATLQSLVNLQYPKSKIDIVVVNDGSKDKTQKLVEEFIERNPRSHITLINQTNHGKGNAMNTGLKHIKGEFFASMDADSFISPEALRIMLPLFVDKEVAAVCPLMKVQRPNNVLQKVQWAEYIINQYYRFLNAKINCVHVTPGPFSIYRTNVIQKLGGYDETTITEDLEIAMRLQKHHYKILQTFDTIVETKAPTSWRTLFRQRVRWYKGSVDNTINYRKLMFNKEYGDYGFIRMPTVVASGVVGLILTGAIIQSFLSKSWRSFLGLKDVNFDVLTMLKEYSFNFNPFALPLFKIMITGTLLALSLFVMFYSFKLVREHITKWGRTWVSMITYLTLYSLFLTTVWFYIAYMFIKRKKNFWF